MDSLLKVGGLALTVMLLSGGYQYLKQHGTVSASVSHAPLEPARDGNGSEHFSPAENLEQLEMRELTSAAQRARAARRPLDIAIYAFTDRALAALLVREAEQGTASGSIAMESNTSKRSGTRRVFATAPQRPCSAASAISTFA